MSQAFIIGSKTIVTYIYTCHDSSLGRASSSPYRINFHPTA